MAQTLVNVRDLGRSFPTVRGWPSGGRTVVSIGVPFADQPEAEIAYYSMEVALRDEVPTFSGGLGVLAGDHLRAAADRALRLAGVTLLYNHGFFRQSLVGGEQADQPVDWSPADELEELPLRVPISICGRRIAVRPWRAVIEGVGGHRVPVHFLDTDLEENAPEDRGITDRLYTSDPYERLRQEAVLGLAGPLLLDTLGYRIRVHHLNEGHGALVPVGLLARRAAAADPGGALAGGLSAMDPAAGEHEVDAVRRRCVFTTHTPVPAGHDRFSPDVVRAVLGDALHGALGRLGCLEPDGTLNMTILGMRCSGFVNGVSLRHRDVSSRMFPSQHIEAITNGVHTATWAAPATAALFDRHLAGWREDSQTLRYAGKIPVDELRAAHAANKRALCAEVRRRGGVTMRPDVFTVGIARRFAAYKRNDLILSDPARLAAVAEIGPVQLVFSGKAHPGDGDGKAMIRHVAEVASSQVGRGVTVCFLEDYGMQLGRLLCAGSDLWLNTPAPPNEASGTSGMKAAVNGVPSLSTLDGWWLEGWVEGVTGWAICAPGTASAARPDRSGGPGVGSAGGSAGRGRGSGARPLGTRRSGGGQRAVPDQPAGEGPTDDAAVLYDLLEQVIVPAYYKDRDSIVAIGRHAIALNGSFFSGHRMVEEYARRAYRPQMAAQAAWRAKPS